MFNSKQKTVGSVFCSTAVQDVSLLSTGLVGLGFHFAFACLMLLPLLLPLFLLLSSPLICWRAREVVIICIYTLSKHIKC